MDLPNAGYGGSSFSRRIVAPALASVAFFLLKNKGGKERV
jgi:hypothetical protein